MFYAVFEDDSNELFEEFAFAVKSNPKYIFSLKSKGSTVSKFYERTVESEHFVITYFNSERKLSNIVYEGWKAYEIMDPMRYGSVLYFKISDPEGRIRLFDVDGKNVHYGNRFFNDISSLIELVHTVEALSKYGNWNEVEEILKKNWKDIPPYINKLR